LLVNIPVMGALMAPAPWIDSWQRKMPSPPAFSHTYRAAGETRRVDARIKSGHDVFVL
jgi:hypothetical protein